jgi:exosortase A-associated hydrolase 2
LEAWWLSWKESWMSDRDQHTIEPFFLPVGQESIFCLLLAPVLGKPRAAVLYLPPFAEEMHKSRRMAALQARQLAQAGYAVLQIDLPGCGDSTGDFEAARWEGWLASAKAAHDWLKDKTGAPVVLWGLRLGALLAAELSAQIPGLAGLVLWQPVANGETFLSQFLRIRVASDMLAEQKTGVAELRGRLAANQAVEVGGYMLAPALASSIDKLRLAQFAVEAPVHWLEVSLLPDGQPSPASAKILDAWAESGAKVSVRVVEGEPFWATQEITECPALLVETGKAVESIAP